MPMHCGGSQATERAEAAEAHASQLASDVARLHDEAERLAAEVTRSDTEAASLRADAETRGAALTALEETLGRIERAAEHKGEPAIAIKAPVNVLCGSSRHAAGMEAHTGCPYLAEHELWGLGSNTSYCNRSLDAAGKC